MKTKSIPVEGSPKAQDRDYGYGPDYNNDVPADWRRGVGQEPGFDKGVHGQQAPRKEVGTQVWGRETAQERYGRK